MEREGTDTPHGFAHADDDTPCMEPAWCGRGHYRAPVRERRGTGPAPSSRVVDPLTYQLLTEIARQDAKHGPFEGTILGRSRLAIACLEDEVEEARMAWRADRHALNWDATREEVLQVAAVAMRALRDAL